MIVPFLLHVTNGLSVKYQTTLQRNMQEQTHCLVLLYETKWRHLFGVVVMPMILKQVLSVFFFKQVFFFCQAKWRSGVISSSKV